MAMITLPPCYKYIAGNISSDKERYYFSKNYFTNMSSRDIGEDEQLSLYMTLQFNHSCGSALSYNGVDLKADEYRATVLESSDIAKSMDCTSYYKQVCAPGRNSVCSTCPYSKTFANNLYTWECSIFKYLIASRDNLASFANIGNTNVFRSTFDIASNLAIQSAGVIKLLSIAYDQLVSSQEEVYSYDAEKDRLEFLVGKISAKASSMNKNVKEIQAINFKALPITWSGVVDDIISSRLPEASAVTKIVQDINDKYGKKPKKKKPTKNEASPLLDMLNSMEPIESKREGAEPLQEDDISEVATDFKNTVSDDSPLIEGDIPESEWDSLKNREEEPEVSADISDEGMSATDGSFNLDEPELDYGDVPAPDYIPEDAYADSELSYEEYDNLIAQENEQREQENESQDEDTVSGGENEDVTVSSEAAAVQTLPKENPKPQTNRGDSTKKYSVPAHPEMSYIFYLVINKRTLKDYAFPVAGNPAEFVNSLRKSKILPVEIVFDEDTIPYLFMFVRNLGRYYYCKLDSNMPSVVEASLRSQSIRKICYQPYYLYSICRLYGVRISAVYSLYSMDAFLHPAALPCKYEEFFDLYKHDYSYSPLSGSGFEDFDRMCNFMQCYIQMNARQLRAINNKELVRQQMCKDEVLGSSFLRIINMKSNEYLFDLDSDGNVVYNMSYDVSARHDGFIVTYTIGMDDVPELSRKELYMMGLVELSDKGRFAKYNIQLITMSDVSMVLFVGIKEYELIITLLQKFYNRYALKQHLEKFTLDVDHQRIYVKDKAYPIKVALPRSYDEAMDKYITTNDAITVEDSHVSVRGKKTQKSRKRQPQKFTVK